MAIFPQPLLLQIVLQKCFPTYFFLYFCLCIFEVRYLEWACCVNVKYLSNLLDTANFSSIFIIFLHFPPTIRGNTYVSRELPIENVIIWIFANLKGEN